MSSWELYETSPNKLTNKVLGKNVELNFVTYSFSTLLPPFYSISELQRKIVSFPVACPQTLSTSLRLPGMPYQDTPPKK